jgi:hypothetical protein
MCPTAGPDAVRKRDIARATKKQTAAPDSYAAKLLPEISPSTQGRFSDATFANRNQTFRTVFWMFFMKNRNLFRYCV